MNIQISGSNDLLCAKKFRMGHLFFSGVVVEFSSMKPPKWLVSNAYKWWWDHYVLALDVNQHISSDFQRITRLV